MEDIWLCIFRALEGDARSIFHCIYVSKQWKIIISSRKNEFLKTPEMFLYLSKHEKETLVPLFNSAICLMLRDVNFNRILTNDVLMHSPSKAPSFILIRNLLVCVPNPLLNHRWIKIKPALETTSKPVAGTGSKTGIKSGKESKPGTTKVSKRLKRRKKHQNIEQRISDCLNTFFNSEETLSVVADTLTSLTQSSNMKIYDKFYRRVPDVDNSIHPTKLQKTLNHLIWIYIIINQPNNIIPVKISRHLNVN